MNRRELLTAALGGLAGAKLTVTEQPTSKRPWAKRAKELAALDDPESDYADFLAFEEWFKAQSEQVHYADLSLNGFHERIALYGIMCDLTDA